MAATLIRNGIVVPMTARSARSARSAAIDPGSVLVAGTDMVAVGPVAAVDGHPRAAAAEVVDSAGHAVIPGLHNCHLHSGLLPGTAESMSLWDWLKAYVDPAHRALTPSIAAAALLLCYAESVLAGTTSVMDMWRSWRDRRPLTRSASATLVPYVADAEGFDDFESMESNRRLLVSHPTVAGGRVRTWGGARAPLLLHPGGFSGGRRTRRRMGPRTATRWDGTRTASAIPGPPIDG